MKLKIRLIILGVVGLIVSVAIGIFFYQNSIGSRANESEVSAYCENVDCPDGFYCHYGLCFRFERTKDVLDNVDFFKSYHNSELVDNIGLHNLGQSCKSNQDCQVTTSWSGLHSSGRARGLIYCHSDLKQCLMTFEGGPNANCDFDTDCESGKCTDGSCALIEGGQFMRRSCGSNLSCNSGYCSPSNLCERIKFNRDGGCNGYNDGRHNGRPKHIQCKTGYCNASFLCEEMPDEGRVSSTVCESNEQCASGYCNPETSRCEDLPDKGRENGLQCNYDRQCNSGYCQYYVGTGFGGICEKDCNHRSNYVDCYKDCLDEGSKSRSCADIPSAGREIGSSCTSNDQCKGEDGVCEENTCVTLPDKDRVNGLSCEKDEQCKSGYCKNNQCKAPISCSDMKWGNKNIDANIHKSDNGNFYVTFELSGRIADLKRCWTNPVAPRSDVAASELLIHPRVFRNGNVLDYNHGYECYPKSHIFCFQGNELNMQQVGSKVKVTTQAKYSYDNYVSKSTKTFKSYLGSIFKKKTSSSYDTYRLKLNLIEPTAQPTAKPTARPTTAPTPKPTKLPASNRDNGLQCSSHGQCSSGYCKNKKCTSMPSKNRPNNVACSSHGQCSSQYCKSSKCTAMPSTNRPNNVSCSSHSQCSSGYCSGGKCKTKPNCNSSIQCNGGCGGAASNTCSSNNGKRTSCKYTKYGGSTNCVQKKAPDQSCTVNNCSSGYNCISGKCELRDCNSDVQCDCDASENTCNSYNGKTTDCKYTTYNGSSLCKEKTAPSSYFGQRCTKYNCSTNHYCSGGMCKLRECDSKIKCEGSCDPAPNSCSENNGMQSGCQYTEYNGSTNCRQKKAPDQRCTQYNCLTGYYCSGGQCRMRECNTFVGCSGSCVATTNTCSENNGVMQDCNYVNYKYPDGRIVANCKQVSAPEQRCTVLTNCSEEGGSGGNDRENGSSCSVNGQCSSGYCNYNVCETIPEEDRPNGVPCSVDQQCSSGYCSAGVCAVFKSEERPNGDSCKNHNQCSSEYCKEEKCVELPVKDRPGGVVCTDDGQCMSNSCDLVDKKCDYPIGKDCEDDDSCAGEESMPVCNLEIEKCVGCMKGDADCDGKINLLDFSRWRFEYKIQLEGGESENLEVQQLCESKDKLLGDTNCDGRLSLIDFSHWRLEYKKKIEMD